MGKLALRGLVLTVVIGLLGLGSYALAGGGSKHFNGDPMIGYQENPDVSTVAQCWSLTDTSANVAGLRATPRQGGAPDDSEVYHVLRLVTFW